MTQRYDLVIIGGGINGASIARDAAGRGLSVLLCEKNDLASGTSSASTKLIHGGLRYLEHYEFRLVRESLLEREVMLNAAPHLVHPMFFVLPHHSGLRSAWVLRLGLFLYDLLRGKSKLPKTSMVDLRNSPIGNCLKPIFNKGFKYIDCWVDDARLVVLNALDAHEKGARILTQTKFIAAQTVASNWQLTLQNKDHETFQIQAKALVNAAGCWVAETLQQFASIQSKKSVRLVKGSHIIVKQLFAHPEAFIFQNADGRIIFAIPYQGIYTLIGTTDIPYQESLDHIEISPREIAYLCKAASEYFQNAIAPEDVVHSYAGVRALFDDGEDNAAEVTRDYVLDLQTGNGNAPVLSIFGGKITTCRKLAEHVLEELSSVIAIKEPNWTAKAVLPGGDLPAGDFEYFFNASAARYPWLDQSVLHRYCRAYGTRLNNLLSGADSMASMGKNFGAGLYEREVRYMIATEWARNADDILLRRSKLGLHISAAERANLTDWLRDNRNNLDDKVSKTDECRGE